MRLKGKTAVVTGGTRGIGKAMVKQFTSDGARVLFTYSQNAGLAQKLEQEIAKSDKTNEGHEFHAI